MVKSDIWLCISPASSDLASLIKETGIIDMMPIEKGFLSLA